MTAHAIITMVVFVGVLLGLAWPLGQYMARVYTRERSSWIERAFYRLAGVHAQDMHWKQYAWCVLLFNLLGLLVVSALVSTACWRTGLSRCSSRV